MNLLKPTLLLLVLLLVLSSCGARKTTNSSFEVNPEQYVPEESSAEAEKYPEDKNEAGRLELSIIDHALDFLGTTYKYGGTSRTGMDCSGLVYTAFFLNNDIPLPRSSREMAKQGEELKLHEVGVGDLLFFITNKRRKAINHVGLIVELAGEVIYFIHSTTSAGVIISTLDERYWQEHFVMARRIL